MGVFISKKPFNCFSWRFTVNLIYVYKYIYMNIYIYIWKIYLDFKFMVKLKERLCFLTNKLCCWYQGGLVVRNPQSLSWGIVGFVFTNIYPAVVSLSKTLKPWLDDSLEENTWNGQIRRRWSTCINCKDGFLSQCYMTIARTCEKHLSFSLVQQLHTLLLPSSLKGREIHVTGHKAPRHCQSGDDETLTAYWAQLKI